MMENLIYLNKIRRNSTFKFENIITPFNHHIKVKKGVSLLRIYMFQQSAEGFEK